MNCGARPKTYYRNMTPEIAEFVRWLYFTAKLKQQQGDNRMTNENNEIASDLLREIAAAADAGSALVLGPQAVKNLRGVLSDVLRAATSAIEPIRDEMHEKNIAKLQALNLPELRRRAYDHGLQEGDRYHPDCFTCEALKQDIALFRRREATSIPRLAVEGDIY